MVTAVEFYVLDPNEADFTLADGDPVQNVIGNDHGNAITGNASDNRILGGGGNDVLTGGGSLNGDILEGGAGNDILWTSGSGQDVLIGGEGVDWACFATAAPLDIDLRNGWTDHAVLSGIENILSGSGNDELAGNSAGNTILGGGGNDTIYGAAGRDRLYGDGGNDILYGDGYSANEGRNHLFGGDGNDWLYSDGVKDTLTGGEGADRFVFQTRKLRDVDRITDFSRSQGDKIVLDRKASFFDSLPKTGALKKAFFARSEARDANDFIVYDKATGAVYYDPDGIGHIWNGQVLSNEARIKFATVKKGLALAAADFLVI